MKFATQHITVKGNGNDKGFKVHRDKSVTWHTSGGNNTVSNVIKHDTVAQAKEYLGVLTR